MLGDTVKLSLTNSFQHIVSGVLTGMSVLCRTLLNDSVFRYSLQHTALHYL